MALFKKKKETEIPAQPSTPPHKFSRLFDRSELYGLDEDDTELRFWLPEAGRIALDEVTDFLDVTEAFWLRVTFLSFLYGEHEYRRMFAHRTEFFGPERSVSRKSASRGVMFSVAPSYREDDDPPSIRKIKVIPSLGKNLFPIKVYVPDQIKSDLQTAAADVEESLSVFVRKLLLSKLLGHIVVPHPFSDLNASGIDHADRWAEFECEEQDIPADEKTDDDKLPEWL